MIDTFKIRLSALNTSLLVAQNHVTLGSNESVTAKVSDANSNENIVAANVRGVVVNASGSAVKEFESSTDTNGKGSYSWTIDNSFNPGVYTVETQVSATTTFVVNTGTNNSNSDGVSQSQFSILPGIGGSSGTTISSPDNSHGDSSNANDHSTIPVINAPISIAPADNIPRVKNTISTAPADKPQKMINQQSNIEQYHHM